MILLIGSIAAGPLLLMTWSLYYAADCWVLAFPLAMILTITLASRDSTRHRRQCLADSYFAQGSILHKLLRSTKITTLGAIVVSVFVTTILLAGVPSWGLDILVLLTLDSLVIALLYIGLFGAGPRLLGVSEGYRSVFARNWTVGLNVGLLVFVFALLQLQQPPPDYIDPSMDLSTTMQTASDPLSSQCRVVDALTRFSREAEAFSWWLMLKSTAVIEESYLRWVAWLLFLINGALGFMAYTRFCVQLIHYAHSFGSKR